MKTFVVCVVDWTRMKNIICSGAPFEGDQQLGQLEMDGIIDTVITVESELPAVSSEIIACNIQYFWTARM